MEDNFEKMFVAVLNGQSVRECEEIYGLDRNKFVEKWKKRFPEGTEQRKKKKKILAQNKSGLQRKEIDDERLGKIVERLLAGEIKTLNEAKELYLRTGEDIDLQTFKENIVTYVNDSNDNELKKSYIEYEARRHPDYSHINFKALFREMIAEEASKKDMEHK